MGNYKLKDRITIATIVAIPATAPQTPDFAGEEIRLDEDKIELHYMAISENIKKPLNESPIEINATSLKKIKKHAINMLHLR